MIAVRITQDFRWCVVGAPSYFATHGRPRSPQDLSQHECIGYRFPTAKAVYRWQFVRRGREFSLAVPGSVVVNDHLSMIAFAKRGVGLAYTADLVAARELASGELEAVLKSHLPTKPGLFLYFPAKSQNQPKLRAFIDFTRARDAPSPSRAPVLASAVRGRQRRAGLSAQLSVVAIFLPFAAATRGARALAGSRPCRRPAPLPPPPRARAL